MTEEAAIIVPPASRPASGGAVASVVGILAVSNVLVQRVLPSRWHVAANLATTAAVALVARAAGRDVHALGLDPARAGAGVRWGLAGSGVTAAALVVVASADATVVADDRPGAMAPAAAWMHLVTRTALGTVLPEEVAFRGVLPALLAAPGRPTWLPGASSSVLFGLWHLLSLRDLGRHHAAVRHATGRVGVGATTAVEVGALSAAGAVLYALRRRAGHLAAPVLVHLTANAVGFGLARRVVGEHA